MRGRKRGGVLLLTAAFLPLLFAILAFGVDAVQAIEAKASQESALQAAQELRMAPAITVRAKNSEDPGGLIARSIMSTLRDEGYEGSVAVWFYEAGPADGLRDTTRRLYAFETVVEDRVPTSFARLFGMSEMPVASSFAASSQPYSEFQTWRPDSVRNGVFRIEAREVPERMSFTAASLDSMPAALRAEIGASLEA